MVFKLDSTLPACLRGHPGSDHTGKDLTPKGESDDLHPSNQNHTASWHCDWLRNEPVTQAGPVGAFLGTLEPSRNKRSPSTGLLQWGEK